MTHLLRSNCLHRVLVYIGKAKGVKCATCSHKWIRKRSYRLYGSALVSEHSTISDGALMNTLAISHAKL